ncbi:hypothetical protein M2352_003045 [Azospirillum fermentarium]|uniref:BrnA antitoxin family protein n=1 Tax=Azospirillum fermentarium TaxID=1233114 RepID=UPI002226A645|nr:BrnA antitoxin family protein [Azospirillum fermentarium]MCW2247411.1 hypothetical protein [Azospirillum fermentarium]
MSTARQRPRKATISLRIDNGIKAAARNYARQRHVPLSSVVRELLIRYVADCARENEQAYPDLFGQPPSQYDVPPGGAKGPR